MAELELDVSVEVIINKSICDLLAEIAAKYGVRINDMSISWQDIESMGLPADHTVRSLSMNTYYDPRGRR